MTRRPHLLTVAHGTRTAAGNEVARALTSAAASRLGWEATTSYVELCAPLFAEAVREVRGPVIAVPLLLSTGYHLRQDLPAALTDLEHVLLGRSLGPDRLLAAAQVERLLEAGATPGQPVVMVAAGSTDPAATADLDRATHLLAQAWGAPVRLATLSGRGTRPEDVVRPGDAVSPYLLATGHFHRKARHDALAAGAAVVAGVVGPHPRVAGLVAERALALAPAALRASA
ncbi:sirohydrochlorin chelatase [Nocardioides albidus]|uniref:Sirohydrochlorin chelatase n=1 Tax=Nocardioides albidus TaxID=1517589 RepID=A0A5C4VS37_9ACTN|nr:CbiX/SirB N-terminal domain-containing protein [Nocardioides albidus]TNM38620.1 sirohydrochlorin chelatase [Nocardioides albidus]